jgi:hypothetical protein
MKTSKIKAFEELSKTHSQYKINKKVFSNWYE